MSADGISGIGAAAVSTIGTLAITGAALKVVDKTAQRINSSGSRQPKHTKSSKSYNVWQNSKHSKKKSGSMLGF